MTEWFEPWHPNVGDRVQYRWQPECPGVYGMLAPVGHPPEYDGMQGMIYEILTYRDIAYEIQIKNNAHRYLVRLDAGSRTHSICAAAIELEFLESM